MSLNVIHEVPAAAAAAPPASLHQLRNNIVRVALQEHARWNQPVPLKERDPRVRDILLDYWRSGAGVPINPQSLASVEFQERHPWSAAFVSWVMRRAGAGPAFAYSDAHANYILAARQNRLSGGSNPFRAFRVREVRPAVGDLVCKSRDGSGATYDNLRPGMKTHCDIVVGVGPRSVTVIGGNVEDSVTRRTVPLTATGHLAPPEYFAVIKLGGRGPASPAPAGPPSVPQPVPPVIPASTSGGTTFYEPIDLGIVVDGTRVRAQTGIFVPPALRTDRPVSLVVYFHGIRNPAITVDQYWNAARDRRFALREELTASGKNAILVVPLLGPRSQMQIGDLARPGGLDRYIGRVLAALRRRGRLPPGARLGSVTLAAHSGGGLAMRTVALASNAIAPRVRACWGFDCTYNRDDFQAWPAWARRQPQSRLVLRYIANSQTAPQAERIRALRVPNIDVQPSPSRDHGAIPRVHFRELLQRAAYIPVRAS